MVIILPCFYLYVEESRRRLAFYYAILPTATEMPAYQLAHRMSDYQYEVAGSRQCSLHDAFNSKCMSDLAS
ncbi:hypothetical protein HBH56_089220 [Parastagonospora nodorum]|uniref:Uncharacterized protein n=1 Tax=Phaeosphaeria nodorum (strain SN15 / ATCC MYA-4574 / FGSC 10173) TaxID=321614 RepID=A0A7U2F3N6_PHANO|nr:hypothetical protein HBH56_089220 [Parastagonospora nodorum]QRC98124.1 hypothetical protein JI435_411560 [Parastagonospora nodorum SN15]KAH3936646.1 hypothetical protein HBH54_023860 [Parastagonospora nodorum]KAH3945743.1 hypothetical protein HBH53_140960 [Parastagonospora nodorum]KAH3966215.1 hypothetical protein HBH51_144410 [Parastagonospora nodorum]